jgi:hypothetical protein
MLNLALGETLSLVQELPRFDNMIKLNILLVSAVDLCFHDLINGFMFHAIRVELCQYHLSFYL